MIVNGEPLKKGEKPKDGDLVEFSFGENGEMKGTYVYDSRYDLAKPSKISCRWIVIDQGEYGEEK